jgi:carbamoyltransferase
MKILGLNAYHGDSAACLVVDGKLVAAVEEERFKRIKHWAGFPDQAVRYCLDAGAIALDQIDHIALNRNPSANLLKKVLFAFSNRPSLRAIRDRLQNAGKVKDIKTDIAKAFGIRVEDIRGRIHHIEHHRAHLASSFLVSPFNSAAVVSIDGFGDFVSTMWGVGKGGDIRMIDQISFPHSLGLFYLAITQFLGFHKYGDEYKVMGLASYGHPDLTDKMSQVLHLESFGRFRLNLDYFLHHAKGVEMVWENGAPEMGRVYSEKLIELFGPPRQPEDPVTSHHKNLAASLQAVYEDAFFHILGHVHKEISCQNLCLAGGCAFNSVANGKIFDRTGFKRLYIQAAAGDGGGAIGAAYVVYNQLFKNSRIQVMEHAFWGPEFSNQHIGESIKAHRQELKKKKCRVEIIRSEDSLYRQTAKNISAGKVVGWFQGRMEWGPRALGNRSIVCDPRRPDMKNILNLKIKCRESFRPFAPVILREAVSEWFTTDYGVPFMQQVFSIREGMRKLIPAVTHVDGSGRLQTVTRSQNLRYYRLIEAFNRLSGIPILLNTSFNENEPIVCTPKEALSCFLRTHMDIIIMGDWFIERMYQ